MNISFSTLKTKNNYPADEVISALQKEIRKGNFENAVFYTLEMLESGDRFITKFWERMLVVVVEDVSDNNCITQINSLKDTYFNLEDAKPWDKDMQAVKAVKILCDAKKDRIVSEIYDYMKIQRKQGYKIKIPEYAIDMHTKKGKELKLNYLDFLERSSKLENEIENKNKIYYEKLLELAKKGIFP
ncbi:hypothetical protein HON03_00570 [archaeon]|jgi:replication-associated recombination protein RarA|nr:hypothetical protein [archaeon]MBT5287514.1 hypothetical protein [archaeon]